MHEIMREEIVKRKLEAAMKKSWGIIAAAIVASISFEVSAAAAENSQKLSGSQIRAKFTGMQLTDEVHWRSQISVIVIKFFRTLVLKSTRLLQREIQSPSGLP